MLGWVKPTDRVQESTQDAKLYCKAVLRIFGGFPSQGQKAKPGTSLYFLRTPDRRGDHEVIRCLVGKGYIRPTERSAALSKYESQVYLLTRKGFNLALNFGSEVLSEDITTTLKAG